MERPPKKVQEARYQGNAGALRAMGKIGGRHSALNRARRKVEREEQVQDAIAEGAKLYSVSPEGDVLPPDPNAVQSIN